MAVGGMVGGGIFSTLGVVIGIAGAWAWLSFVAAGLVENEGRSHQVSKGKEWEESTGERGKQEINLQSRIPGPKCIRRPRRPRFLHSIPVARKSGLAITGRRTCDA